MKVEGIWPLVRLDSIIFDTQPGFARSPNTDDSGVPQLRPNNVSSDGNIELSLVKYVDASPSEREKYGVRRDDVIFNNTNSPDLVGRTACLNLDEEYVISNHMTRIRVNETLIAAPFLARYLHYLWMVGYSQSRAKQWVNQAAIDQKELSRFQILLPPLSEQRRIVDILRQADELRRLRRQADEQVKNLPAALFYEVFLKDEEKLRHWGSIKLGKVAPFVTSGSRGWAKYYADSGGKFIRVQNVLEGELDFDDLAFVQPPEGPGRDRSAIMPGDLLITITGTVGRVAVAPDNIGEAYVSQHVAIARLDGSISPQYVAAFLNHPLGGQLQIARQNYGQTKPGLNLAQIQSLRIPRPPDDLIAYFENQADGTRKVRLNCSTSAMMLDELSQSLLARAFTGKLTAAWREQHTEALAAEARQRDQALGLRARVVRPVEPEMERLAVPLDETHPRYTILHELSSVQQQVYQAVLQTEGYFSAENLMPASGLSPDIKRRTLTLLELLGLVARASLPSTPTSDAIFYVPAHRASQATDDGQDDDLATLKAAFPELGI